MAKVTTVLLNGVFYLAFNKKFNIINIQKERNNRMKEKLSAQAAKVEFAKHFHRYMINSLKQNGNEGYSNCFRIEGSSIMCDLPVNFFNDYIIPEITRIEIKFIVKKA